MRSTSAPDRCRVRTISCWLGSRASEGRKVRASGWSFMWSATPARTRPVCTATPVVRRSSQNTGRPVGGLEDRPCDILAYVDVEGRHRFEVLGAVAADFPVHEPDGLVRTVRTRNTGCPGQGSWHRRLVASVEGRGPAVAEIRHERAPTNRPSSELRQGSDTPAGLAMRFRGFVGTTTIQSTLDELFGFCAPSAQNASEEMAPWRISFGV